MVKYYYLFACASVLWLAGCGSPISINSSGATNVPLNTGINSADANLLISETDPFNFGLVTGGTSVSHTFVIFNTGNIAATQINVVPPTVSGFTLQSTTCSNTTPLLPNTACTAVVSFSPPTVGAASPTGAIAGQLAVNYFNGLSQASAVRNMTGSSTSLNIGHLDLTSGSPNFGVVPVGSSPVSTAFIFTSDGSAPVTGMTIGPLTGNNFAFQQVATLPAPNAAVPPCSPTLVMNPGASCFIVIAFNPTLSTGTSSLEMSTTMITAAATAGTQTIDFTVFGTAGTAAVLAVSPSPSTFLNVPIQPPAPIFGCMTINNSGGSPATNLQIAPLTLPFALIPAPACNNPLCSAMATLSPGISCDVPVSFNPQVVGPATSPFDISYNNGLAAMTGDFTVTGTAIIPTITSSVAIVPNQDQARPQNCSYVIDPYGVGQFVGCNQAPVDALPGFSNSASVTLGTSSNPNVCNMLRVQLWKVTGDPTWLAAFSGPANGTLIRDTATGASTVSEYMGINATVSGNTVSYDIGISDTNPFGGFNSNSNDHEFTIALPLNWTIQNWTTTQNGVAAQVPCPSMATAH